MKILIDHPWPFALAHGGFQIQIEQTRAALERIGIVAEYLRWWDDGQRGDIIHYFGRPAAAYVDFAHARGIKVVVSELLTGLGSRSASARLAQKSLMHVARGVLPETFTSRLAWDVYRKADRFIALTSWEAHLMQAVFGASTEKIRVVPNGVEELFFATEPSVSRGDFLICTATIDPRKRILELAYAAVRARVPLWIIGKPYSESDSYYRSFLAFQKEHPDIIRYEGALADRSRLAQIYREARGFVLLSQRESLSLSALEAAASGCPLLLADLPWARSVFGPQASYLPLNSNPDRLGQGLRDFYDRAPSSSCHFKPETWVEIAQRLFSVYKEIIHPA